MDPPLSAATTTTSPPPPTDSVSDDATAAPKLRLMFSYGGHIIPRPHDKTLCYIGGDTKIIVVDRHVSLSELKTKLSKSTKTKKFSLKYQLPNEDLDSLISLSTDDDFENMIDEYDRVSLGKWSRLRVFLFPDKSESSIESLLESSTKSEDWFLEALNGIRVLSQNSVCSESNSSINCLLGLDEVANNQKIPPPEKQNIGGGGSEESLKDKNCNSVPDSPMVDGTSSYGSGSSVPSMANLPPIRVHVEEKSGGGLGIEEQFNQMTGGIGVVGSSPSGAVMTGVPVMGGEFGSRVVSDDERSDQGGTAGGYRKALQVQHQPAQFQHKPAGFVDLPSPDSISSDGSVTNPLSRQRQMVYQEQIMHMQSANNRTGANVVVVDQKINDPNNPNNRGQMQQKVQESEYMMPGVYEQHPQLHHQQQFVHPGVQYIHSHTAGGVPIASYYPMYHSQQQQQQHPPHHQGSEQQFVYYMPPANRPAQAYNMPVQQQSYGESPTAAQASRPQTPPHPTALVNPAAAYNAMNVPASKPEIAAGAYRTAPGGAPQLVQVQSSQHHPQYVGYQMHHPSQSIRPSSGALANYAYSEPTHPQQMYYTQALAPQMSAQYQTVTSSPMVMLSGNASQVPTENIKQQNNNSHL